MTNQEMLDAMQTLLYPINSKLENIDLQMKALDAGFRHLLFLANSKNPVFKPFVAYFFVKFLKFICCMGLYFYGRHAIIQGYGGSSHET